MLVDNLLTWASSLPPWQQDALRRIAQTTSISEGELREIQRNVYITNGLLQAGYSAPQPISREHLPAQRNQGPRTVLRSIGNVRNTNRLAPGQVLRFAIDGVTLIYGDNGSGKSGYCRIAKKLCRARTVEPILGNIFEADMLSPASATVRFEVEGSPEQAMEWRDGDPAPEATSRICVFDSRNASVYIDDRNRVDFLPLVVEIVRQLGLACIRLGEMIKDDIAQLEKRLTAGLPGYPADTEVASLVGQIARNTPFSTLPSVSTIDQLGRWSAEDDDELERLEFLLSNDVTRLAAQRDRSEKVCLSLAEELESIEMIIGDHALSELRAKYGALIEARQLVEAASSGVSAEPLGHIGSDCVAQTVLLRKRVFEARLPGDGTTRHQGGRQVRPVSTATLFGGS